VEGSGSVLGSWVSTRGAQGSLVVRVGVAGRRSRGLGVVGGRSRSLGSSADMESWVGAHGARRSSWWCRVTGSQCMGIVRGRWRHIGVLAGVGGAWEV
jgi:hypothetical protein